MLNISVTEFESHFNQTLSRVETEKEIMITRFSALPNLQSLDLRYNQLTGAIPDFSALPNLQWLRLYNNQLTGAIPDFSALPNLLVLYLDNNQLTGAIPDFNALPQLKTLYLDDNQLTGAIPDFSALTELEYLDLRNNPICKGNINYAIWPIKAKWWSGEATKTWQEQLDGFPNCPVNPPPPPVTVIPIITVSSPHGMAPLT